MSLDQHNKAIFFLNFEDTLNLGKDISGKDNNGTPSNVAAVATLDGKTNVTRFDPTLDSGIDLTSVLSTFNTSTSLSGSVWFRLAEIGAAGSVRCIFSASDNTQASREIIVFVEAAQLKFQIRNSASIFQIVGGTLSANIWYHAAFTCGPLGANLWLNGTSLGTNVSTASIGTIVTNRCQVGYNVDSANGGAGREFEFNGWLKDLFISTTELSSSTVTDIYNNDIYGYEVIHLPGQSNQIGRADIVAGVDDDYTTVSGKVFQWGYNANARLAATNPLDHVNEAAGDMGHWLSLCNNLVPLLAYKKAIMLVPCAQGGTGFITNDWNPGNVLYEAALSRMNSGYSYHAYSSLFMIHWIQGETDADNGNTNYQANIQAMYDDLDGRALGFSTAVPFVCVTIKGSTVPANVAVINSALSSFVAAGPERYLINANDLTLFDQFHYDAASLRTIGQRTFSLFDENVILPFLPFSVLRISKSTRLRTDTRIPTKV